MPTPTKGARLGGSPAHERMLLANLATSLFEHGRITTTEAKAKRLRPFAERLITKARRGDLHNRREIMKVIRDKSVVHKLIAEIGPFFENRPGGYTRITKTVPRKGDNAQMAVIELVREKLATEEAEAARGTRFAKDQAATHEHGSGDTATADQSSEAADTEGTDTAASSAGPESAEGESAEGESSEAVPDSVASANDEVAGGEVVGGAENESTQDEKRNDS